MKSHRADLLWALSLGAAAAIGCGDDAISDGNDNDGTHIDASPDSPPVDAAIDMMIIDAMEVPYDYSCATNPAPTAAPATVTASGTAQSLNPLGGSENLADVLVEALSTSDGTVLASDTSAQDGDWAFEVTTGGAPVDAYLRLTKAGYRRTVVYPPQPLTASLTDAPAPIVTPETFDLIESFAAVMQDDSANGALLIAAFDCTGAAIEGVTISVKQNGTEVGDQFDLGAFQPGAWAIFNVPEGAVEVNATYAGHTLRAHTVKVFNNSAAAPNGTITATLIQPGYLGN